MQKINKLVERLHTLFKKFQQKKITLNIER